MTEHDEHLFRVFDNLFRIRNECSCGIFSECGLSDLTVKQIRYLKTIDENGEVTFSRLAEITRTSKPTITETVNKFVRLDCVYRQPCAGDGRIQYIRLTDKGQMIARAEEQALRRVIMRMLESLDEQEIEDLIGILSKVR
ncbi:MarR family winged helix-turn-helix transcriptional regulator [uncultured Methanoregula sp.]|uniref:MarR family winged helix-turn-helix transcriptional regulator n=1 Tax=uncultured Methanoregula sp. TaxID=1005933 RepID=UPI002AAB3FA0|nr:MarR family winged helix-turn-helix transcriptional regulator [uncultured Methanoregula sp.]